jgi:hypothetical protein
MKNFVLRFSDNEHKQCRGAGGTSHMCTTTLSTSFWFQWDIPKNKLNTLPTITCETLTENSAWQLILISSMPLRLPSWRLSMKHKIYRGLLDRPLEEKGTLDE